MEMPMRARQVPGVIILHEVSTQLLLLGSRASLSGLLSHRDGQGSLKSAAGTLRHGLESARVVYILSPEGEVTEREDWAEGLGSPTLSAPKSNRPHCQWASSRKA